ncbi:MAG TPA: hypothetical protein VK607_15485, partial [Kofleriaceae bacterium]|nr:hypothetical protein [Kofleriaceae bacterium]
AAASDSAPAQAPAPSTRGGRGAADGPPQAPIAPSTRSGRVTGDAPPFVKTPFDDADNERVAPPPPSAVKVKKTPVIPGFDN